MSPRIRQRSSASPGQLDWSRDLHPVLARVYAARGIVAPEAADYRLAGLPDPTTLLGIGAALDLLSTAITEDQAIRIVGDFDADGATGTAVAVKGLRALGARRVDFMVPNRFSHGYGLSPALVADMAGALPDLIITVDNGIAAHAGVAAARQRGMRVLVTDHHLPGATLPAADAIVNPQLDGDGFPSKAVAGVGVMFFVLLALRRRLRDQGWFGPGREEPNLADLLDLVALGTVADLVPLDYHNRLLVAQGLRRIRAGRGSAGLQALIGACGRNARTLACSDLGFAIAPRLNAAGRMDDMSIGIACLLSDEPMQAQSLAARLDELNAERRDVQQKMQIEAQALLERIPREPDGGWPLALALFDPGWHSGVVGLIASRLKEQCHRPAVALAPAGEDGGEIKGSARSIAGFHIRDALAELDARHPGLMDRFGGHAMAAGMSLRAENLAAFQTAFVDIVSRRMDPDSLKQVLWTDGPLQAEELNLDLAWALRMGGPWGQAFPEPAFDNVFQLDDCRPMGRGHLRFKLRMKGSDSIDAVAFNQSLPWTETPRRVRAVYQLEVNDFRGLYAPRLLLRHIEAA